MKGICFSVAVGVALILSPSRAAMTVIDFEEYAGSGNRIEFPANFHGVTFGPDFGTWAWPGHSGDVAALSNRIADGPKECFFSFTNPDQRFVGAWVDGFDPPLQFRMYKGGQLVASSATVARTSGWVFLPSGYDGAVDQVGVVGTRGQYGLDDITFTTIERPPAPRRAQANATVVGGKIIGFTVTDSGYGYRSVPIVMITDATGVEAAATATIVDQKIQSISLVNGGRNYSATPFVRIGLPDFVAGLKVSFSKIKVEMSLDIGQRYQLYSSSDLKGWTMVGEPFTAQTDSQSVEFNVQPVWVYYQLRRLD